MSSARFLFAAVLISSFVTPFLAGSINVAIPAISAEFQVTSTFLSWAVTSFLLGAACTLLPFGRLADIVGRKRLFRIGTVCVILTTVCTGLVPDAESLCVLRFLQGVSTSMIFSTGMALLVASCKPEERGKNIGYSTAAVYSGLTLGPFLGGIITQFFGWRMIFLLSGLLMILCWLLIRKVEEEWYGARNQPMDYYGSGLYCISSFLLLFGLSTCRTSAIAFDLIVLGLIPVPCSSGSSFPAHLHCFISHCSGTRSSQCPIWLLSSITAQPSLSVFCSLSTCNWYAGWMKSRPERFFCSSPS